MRKSDWTIVPKLRVGKQFVMLRVASVLQLNVMSYS
ncbi:hypothetical protein ALQ83_200342 [Pseudomonas syringae pv. berberidis]|nr:hypothetical protein ALQ83_200342 [Pseudomonas syringae pv. berberidis]